MTKNRHTVAVLGASNKPDRYSNMAIRALMEAGYDVLPVHPRIKDIEGLKTFENLTAIDVPVHTLTMYVSEKISKLKHDEIISLKPSRVIFNPGTENELLQQLLKEKGIEVVTGCTLVMLKTNQF